MNKIFFTTFLAFFLIGSSFCDEELTSTEEKELNYWATAIAHEVHEKCVNVTGNEEDAVKFFAAVDRTMECVINHVNITALGVEIEESLSNDVYEGLFNKSCHKLQDVFECVTAEQSYVDACLTESEIVEKNTLFGLIKKVSEYLCGADGDVLTVFLGGLECFEEKKEQLQACAETSFGSASEVSTKIKTTTYDKNENCGELTQFQSCVIPLLETCDEEKIQATLTNGLFAVIFEELSCPKVVDVSNEI